MELRIGGDEGVTRPLQDIGLSVKRLQMRHHRALNAELAALGISLVQWDALRHLDQNPGTSLHDLARLTFQSDQSLSSGPPVLAAPCATCPGHFTHPL